MSQKSLEVQRLEALLRHHAEEARAIKDQLNRARSSVSAAPPGFDSISGDYQVAASRPSLDDHGRSGSNTVPRSAVGAGVPLDMGLKMPPRHSQQQQDQSPPMKRSKTAHHAAPASSTGKMMRSASNASTMTPAKPATFVAQAPVPATPPYHSVARNNNSGSSMLHEYLLDQFQQPANALIHADSLYSGQHLGRSPDPLAIEGRELGIAEFLSMRGDNDGMTTTSPVQIPPSTLLSPGSAQFSIHSNIPSACGSMTSGPTIETAPMTRSNSTMNDNSSISDQLEMVRIRSQQSSRGHGRQDSFSHAPVVQHLPVLGKRPAMQEPELFGMGPDFNAYGSSAPVDSNLFEHQHPMQKSLSQTSTRSSSSVGLLPLSAEFNAASLAQHLSMERSVSKDSVRSNQSLKHRAKEALTRQNINALSRIQPKPAGDAIKQEPVESTINKGKDGKAVIAKARYERPKHPKVKCTQCNEIPQGFRGEHELRRHTEAKHKSTVRKWICRDPADDGIPHTETAIKPLRDCKQCSQHKQYGAYYNAAAHLRRTHFKVKPARKGTGGTKNGAKGPNAASKADDEKRGGKGGGDWPPMNELKLWMVEVNVHMDQEGALVPDSVESVGALDQEDIDNELMDSMGYGSQGLAVDLSQDDYDMAGAFAGVGGGFNHDLNVDSSYQTMQGELGSQGPELYIDTMYPASSLHNMPISSSSFDFNPSSHSTQHQMSSSMMSIDSHNYTSPVSSTATITQAGVFGDHLLAPPNMHLARDDLADMGFDMAFTASQ